ncbi:hypothetical protein [Bartonella sp. TS25HLJMH]
MICVFGVGDCGCFGSGCEGGEMGRTDGVIVRDKRVAVHSCFSQWY